MAIVEPLLAAWQGLREQIVALDRQMKARAKDDAIARLLMTVPGVGVVVALAYVAVIDDPLRFKHSESVGAYLGLTPCRNQSGEVDVTGKISRCGDGLLRSYLFEAATVILQRMSRASWLKAWGSRWPSGSACVAPRSPCRASSPSSCTACGWIEPGGSNRVPGRRRRRRSKPASRLAPCLRPSSPLRAASGGGLRPGSTDAARAAFGKAGRDEETALPTEQRN